MNTQDAFGPSMTPPAPPAPPTEPIPVTSTAAASSWPKVIGIISIVLGAFGAVGGCWSAVSPLFVESIADFMASMPAQGQQPAVDMLKATQEWAPWTVAVSLWMTVAAIILLVSGIGLLKRRRWGVTASRVWAVVKMPAVGANAVVGYVIITTQFQNMGQDPNMPPMPQGFFGLVGVFSVVVSILWGWAYPVFLLIWLARRPIHDEYTRWDRRPA